MRIAVANLTAGGLSGGYRKYLTRLMPLIAADRRVAALTVFVPPIAAGTIAGPVDARVWREADTRRRYAGLAERVLQLRPDVVFVPTARHADFGRVPVVTMVRNMEPLAAPFCGHRWSEGVKNSARAWEARRACRRAARVIAVSNHVREFLVDRWHVDAARIGTVYHGVDTPEIAAPGSRHSRRLFTAGSIRPARGLEDAIHALALLEPDVELFIAGRADPGCERYASRLRSLAEQLRVSGRITWAGQLEALQMQRAFQNGAVFVMTSRVEACPNVVLEAMSCGCPSVSVDRAPMPELFGEAAVYYPCGDAAALARRVRGLMESPAEQDRLRQVALDRARIFTWDRTCDRTIQELQRALS